MNIIHLALRSEYTFKKVFGSVDTLANYAVNGVIGIADYSVTFAHPKLCKMSNKIKPIFAVRLMVVMCLDRGVKNFGPEMIFIAKNQKGLSELYGLVKKSWENFYYFPRTSIFDVVNLSENIIVIGETFITEERVDYVAMTQTTPDKFLNNQIPRVAIINNRYPSVKDKAVYEVFSSSNGIDLQTYPQHILSTDEWFSIWGDRDAIENTHRIADECSSFNLKKSENLKFTGKGSILGLCVAGAKKRGIDIFHKEYSDRLDMEINLIKEKDFGDYFLIVADMISEAKKTMLVGPSRGSSAGSLVCYLMGITEVDPLKYGLIFERFIDINRADLPDIDIDFPDVKRDKVIKYLSKKYGADKVAHISTVSTMQPTIAIGEFSKALGIPPWETEDVKKSIVEVFAGDNRSNMCISDTLSTTQSGKDLIEKYPQMELTSRIEGHARHFGKHAAGIVVGNENLEIYSGVNVREGSLMIDKKDAEYLNLLKIDCLGLRTLSILEECAELSGFDFRHFYDMPLDNKKVFDIFNNHRVSGIFQFEGYAVASVSQKMGVHNFNDIVAITALARPGPLHSGGADTYIKRRTGQEKVEYISNDKAYVDETSETFGVIIYQEQLMTIARNFGGLSWEDVSALRKAASKSLGEEYFNKYRDNFLEGTEKRGVSPAVAIEVWENMVTFGAWGFNKSHAVSYALISYWTACAKAYYPLQFAVANLNHSRGDEQSVKLLRDMVTNDGIEYSPIDPEKSDIKWTVSGGKLIGGLTNLYGIGIQKAKDMIQKRKGGTPYTKAQSEKLMNPSTAFDILFPAEHYWGDIYKYPKKFGLSKKPSKIKDVHGEGTFTVIAKIVEKNLIDLNELSKVVSRGGEIIEGNSLYLSMKIEDDTDGIHCSISKYKFEQIGIEISESARVGIDWFLIKGKIRGDYRKINASKILWLNREFGDGGIQND